MIQLDLCMILELGWFNPLENDTKQEQFGGSPLLSSYIFLNHGIGDMLGELQGTFWPYTFRDFQGQIEIHFDKMEKRPTWPANFDGDWWDLEDFQLLEHMLFTYYALWYVILYIHYINRMWALIDVLWYYELLLIRYNMYSHFILFLVYLLWIFEIYRYMILCEYWIY